MRKLLVFPLLISCQVFADNIPPKIQELLIKNGISIDEYSFNSKRVFLIDSREECCDLGATVYDINGDTYCRYIGIAGAWEEKCIGFDENAKYIKRHRHANNGT